MKKLLCILGPFNTEQVAYVYEDGNKLDVAKFNMANADVTLERLIAEYDIQEVELRGPKQYSKGIWDNFTLYTKSKYSDNNFREIKVKYI